MSVSDLNHFMTYVIEGWMLFSAGFIGITFVSFVSRRIQEDIEAAELAQAEGQTEDVTVSDAVESAVAQTETASLEAASSTPPSHEGSTPETTGKPAEDGGDSGEGDNMMDETATDEEKEAARLEEVAVVSENLAKTKGKQSNTSSVSVST